MHVNEFFQHLWRDYTAITPQAQAIHNLFRSYGETVINDHVAFRTLSDSPIELAKLVPVLNSIGYQAYDKFRFEEKKLNATAFKHTSDPTAPKIFLSELQVHELPLNVQQVLRKIIRQIPHNTRLNPSIFWRGLMWARPSKREYDLLQAHSDYAAWVATLGLRANHFTVSINELHKLSSIENVNQVLLANGYKLNESGGQIKGTKADLLRQSSTLADTQRFVFADGTSAVIPTCFYEFAQRELTADGKLFDSFIEGNANQIFESTNVQPDSGTAAAAM